jgi:hypothetical protein
MGQTSVFEIIRKVKEVTQEVAKWKCNQTIMIDVFMRRERHVYMKKLDLEEKRQSTRDFGPQNEDDLIDQRNLKALEKLLPVLNGLLYLSQGI